MFFPFCDWYFSGCTDELLHLFVIGTSVVLPINCFTNTTLQQVRDHLLETLKAKQPTISRIKFMHENTELKKLHKTLQQLGIDNGSTVSFFAEVSSLICCVH
jgi:hypothetical protein